jgi:hypothetical protein
MSLIFFPSFSDFNYLETKRGENMKNKEKGDSVHPNKRVQTS